MTVFRLSQSALCRRAFASAVLLAGVGATAAAQSNLSIQGFGYPPGQFSARANGTGGAIAEADPFSPINPASIAVLPSRVVFFQMEPEYRTVTTPRGNEHTSTARYPVVMGALPLGNRWVISASSSTMLDRSSTTSFQTTQVLTAIDSVPMTTTYNISGAMNDNRFAVGWSPKPWARVGVGLHAITGHNLVNITQTFEDTVRFASFAQQSILGFSGSAYSVGLQLISSQLVFSGSARWGGRLSVSVEDTILGRANVPNRFGGSLAYVGLANSAISVRTAYENWASIDGLGTPALDGQNGWDTSVGGDFAGPRVAGRLVFLRVGGRTRTLAFEAAEHPVHEKSVSAGLGTTFANGRVIADLATIRAFRSADIGAKERAWTLSFGISVRP